jgi:hypothetical protein
MADELFDSDIENFEFEEFDQGDLDAENSWESDFDDLDDLEVTETRKEGRFQCSSCEKSYQAEGYGLFVTFV